MKMKIAIDARCLNRAYLRGMGKYVWNLLLHTPPAEDVEWLLLGDRPDLPSHIPDLSEFEVDLFDQRGHRFQLWEQWALPQRAISQRAAVLHATSTALPWWQPVPTVVTIHDTVPWEGTEMRSESWFWKRLIPSAYRKCAAMITISESSRRDILRLWPELEEKLHVIPHGIERRYLHVKPGPLDSCLSEIGVKRPYLLYLGGGIPRKRLEWAMQVWQRLDDPDLQLVVCGLDTQQHARYLQKVDPKFREKLCLPSFIPEESMPRLYQNACAVLYPTLYEGFGLPALEAQAVGTPVLFSSVGSLAELQGPGAVVLPAEDLGAWVSAARRAVNQRRDSLRLNEAARRWASDFSWEESARKHLDVYRSVLSPRGGERHPVAAESSRGTF